MNQKHLPTIFSLCFVLFLDGLGQGIMLPVFAETLTSRETHVLLVNSPDWVKQLYYGLTMGLFFLFWFFGAAFLGDLSDRIGRKKALIFCLFGLFIGNMVTGLAFTLREPWILLAGRIIAGISSGDQPIAQAAIIDNMPKHKLAQGLGWVLCSLCLGIIVGPIIGYVLSEQRFVAWFVPSTPFYFTSFLILINICVMQFYFHETVQVSEKRRFSLIRSFQVFAEAFKYPVIKILSLCFLLGQMAWSVYLLFTPEFIVQS